MATGQDLLDFAATKIGQRYVYGAVVPINNPNWNGPWDCAELATYIVRWEAGKVYGCIINSAKNPDAYTGAWARDANKRVVIKVPVDQAASMPGGILLRYRSGDNIHHIVFADGKGGTIEAKGAMWGVCRDRVHGRGWNIGILIPGVDYKEV